VLDPDTDRVAYFSCAESCGNLFLDPDTGIRVETKRDKKGSKEESGPAAACSPHRWRKYPHEYLCSSELVKLVERRSPSVLTLVFDKGIARGSERLDLEAKLAYLAKRGIYSFAYWAQAGFVVAGMEQRLVEEARARIIVSSGLPDGRLLPVACPVNASSQVPADRPARNVAL
jgi:hypothetical protein